MKTFEQICPRWSKKLKSKNPGRPSIVDHKRLDIQNESRCIVGEAWGFTEQYVLPRPRKYCPRCLEFSVDIASHFYRNCVHPNVNIDIHEFVAHWNKEHLKKG